MITKVYHLSSDTFCMVVHKIWRSCSDQSRLTLELVYPGICTLVSAVLESKACPNTFLPQRVLPAWNSSTITMFKHLILKYTEENIIKVNIYIKDPFAKKYMMVEHASM